MLLRFKIRNFLSFHEETVFDMFPNIKREKFQHHIYTDMEAPLLKQAVIYGANGSGKSNFVKAIIFLRDFITHDNFLQSIDLDDYIFQLTNEKSTTVSFEIEFFQKNKYYIYHVDINKIDIAERLFISGLGKTEDELIFERDGTNIKSPYLQNKDIATQLLAKNLQVSLLFSNLQYPVLDFDIKVIYDWFSKQLEIITINSLSPILIDIMSSRSELLQFTNEVFARIGIGINSVEIIENDAEQWFANPDNANLIEKILGKKTQQNDFGISQIKNDRNVWNLHVKQGNTTIQELVFVQQGQSGYHKRMNIMSQSDGTVRLLTLIPGLFDAMRHSKTVFIDEIDNSIHPNLVFELIRFYSHNETNGQLIFTTHTTKLLNQQKLLRPDEIWLTEKSDGNTKMFSLNDFKLQDTANIENGYLDGRYGAIPVIEDLSVEV